MHSAEIMTEGSRIIRSETPRIRVNKTTDVFNNLTPIERVTLYWAERLGLKLLCQTNKRHDND